MPLLHFPYPTHDAECKCLSNASAFLFMPLLSKVAPHDTIVSTIHCAREMVTLKTVRCSTLSSTSSGHPGDFPQTILSNARTKSRYRKKQDHSCTLPISTNNRKVCEAKSARLLAVVPCWSTRLHNDADGSIILFMTTRMAFAERQFKTIPRSSSISKGRPLPLYKFKSPSTHQVTGQTSFSMHNIWSNKFRNCRASSLKKLG